MAFSRRSFFRRSGVAAAVVGAAVVTDIPVVRAAYPASGIEIDFIAPSVGVEPVPEPVTLPPVSVATEPVAASQYLKDHVAGYYAYNTAGTATYAFPLGSAMGTACYGYFDVYTPNYKLVMHANGSKTLDSRYGGSVS